MTASTQVRICVHLGESKSYYKNWISNVIFAGFWFLGLAYGIYMNASGFSFVYPMLMSLLIFGDSLEFVAVEMLLSPFAPLQILIMTLLIQARHLFYGISMLDKYKGMGWKNSI